MIRPGTLAVFISALCFSTLPLFGVKAFEGGANVVTMLSIRFLTASALLWLYVLLRREKLPDGKTIRQLLFLGGVGYAAMSTLYLSSVDNNRLSPGIAALLLYTYPVIVTTLAWKFENYRLTKPMVMGLCLTLVGVALVLISPNEKMIVTLLGSIFALGASLVYSNYIFWGGRITKKTSAVVSTTIICTGAFLVFLMFGLFTQSLFIPSTQSLMASAGAGFVATVLAIAFFFYGLEILGPSKTASLSTVEPVGTILFSILLLGEMPNLTQILGAVLVLGGVALIQKSDSLA